MRSGGLVRGNRLLQIIAGYCRLFRAAAAPRASSCQLATSCPPSAWEQWRAAHCTELHGAAVICRILPIITDCFKSSYGLPIDCRALLRYCAPEYSIMSGRKIPCRTRRGVWTRWPGAPIRPNYAGVNTARVCGRFRTWLRHFRWGSCPEGRGWARSSIRRRAS